MIYSHVKADGRIETIESEKPLGLPELQRLVGGFIEFTTAPDLTVLCVNEEGLLKGLPRNARYNWLRGDVVEGRYMSGADGVVFVGLL